MLASHLNAVPHCKYIASDTVPRWTWVQSGSGDLRSGFCCPHVRSTRGGSRGTMLQGVLKLMNAAIKISAEAVACSLIREVAMGVDSQCLRVQTAGFEMWGCSQGFGYPQTGKVLDFGAAFFRP